MFPPRPRSAPCCRIPCSVLRRAAECADVTRGKKRAVYDHLLQQPMLNLLSFGIFLSNSADVKEGSIYQPRKNFKNCNMSLNMKGWHWFANMKLAASMMMMRKGGEGFKYVKETYQIGHIDVL